MRSKFDRGLRILHDNLIEMGTLIEQAIARSITALKEHDPHLFPEVVELEHQADELERAIESRALRIILQQQPVASDLRKVSTALKMITDMERIADQAVDIAEIVSNFPTNDYIKNPEHIIRMGNRAMEMVSTSIDAYVTNNFSLASEIIIMDDEVDELFTTVRSELVVIMHDHPERAEQAIDFIMIAKYIERIADHAVNIADWVIFNITGEHRYPANANKEPIKDIK